MISTTLKLSRLDCASIPGYLLAADRNEANLLSPQSEKLNKTCSLAL